MTERGSSWRATLPARPTRAAPASLALTLALLLPACVGQELLAEEPVVPSCEEAGCPAGEACVEGSCQAACVPVACPLPPSCDLQFDSGCGIVACGCEADDVCVDGSCCTPTCAASAGCLAPDGCGGLCEAGCSRWQYLESTPPDLKPQSRDEHGMAGDPARGVVVIVGGRLAGGSTILADSWELRLDPTHEPPTVTYRKVADGGITPRFAPRLVHGWGELLLYGGCDDPDPCLAPDLCDCWNLLRYTGDGWEIVETTGDPWPGERSNFGLAFDEQRGQVILYGGTATTDDIDLRDDLFTLDHEPGGPYHWTLVPDAGAPGKFSGPGFAWDGNAGAVRYFAGRPAPTSWLWRDGAWVEAPVPPLEEGGPVGRGHLAAAWEPGRGGAPGRFVAYGGSRSGAGAPCNQKELPDSWEVGPDGTFRQATTGACDGSPSPRNRHALALEPLSGRLLLFGGSPGSTTSNEAFLLEAPVP